MMFICSYFKVLWNKKNKYILENETNALKHLRRSSVTQHWRPIENLSRFLDSFQNKTDRRMNKTIKPRRFWGVFFFFSYCYYDSTTFRKWTGSDTIGYPVFRRVPPGLRPRGDLNAARRTPPAHRPRVIMYIAIKHRNRRNA